MWLFRILPLWIRFYCILFSIYSHYSKWLNADNIHTVTAIINSSKATWTNEDLVCLTKLMWLLHITVHSFFSAAFLAESFWFVGMFPKRLKKIKIHFLPFRLLSLSLLTHAERLMSSTLHSKSPLPMWPNIIQKHSDSDPMWAAKATFCFITKKH